MRLASYQSALAIAETLAARDPADLLLQHSLLFVRSISAMY